MKYDIAILIPSRNEEFLSETMEDILSNIRGNTEILVGLDGQWAVKPISQHERVTILYEPESIGQRAIINKLCRLTSAKYIMKTDAHCAFDEGFDVKMLKAFKEVGDDVTMVPVMKNLHVFNWVCKNGHKRYQGPSGLCKECGELTEKDILWRPKPGPNSTSYCFDKTMHFQYFNKWKKEQVGDIVETMSLQGSCFMLTRDKYWELNICDESHGGWGQQGVEVACATWLSGGRVLCNKKTWYAHMFRTQGGDFGFPYPLGGRSISKAREYSKDLWFNGKHLKQIRPLSWLLKKFWPVLGWEQKDLVKLKGGQTKGIIYYTDNKLQLKIARAVQKQLNSVGLPIVSASLKPMPHFGKNIHIKAKRGYITMTKQILAAVEASDADIIFFTEHDVLYPKSHFDFTPPNDKTYYYNVNVWKVRLEDNHAVKVDDCRQLSGLCTTRDMALQHFKKRLELLNKKAEEVGEDSHEFKKYVREMGFEPGTNNRSERVDDYKSDTWSSVDPIADIRHDGNLTPSRWDKEQFRNQIYTKGWVESDDGIHYGGKITIYFDKTY